MLGVYVTVPVACFRKGLARAYLETELLPPPSTCYGFLLSLVGETSRDRHGGAAVTSSLLSTPDRSVVLRTLWRLKKLPLGSSSNTRPDYQQLLSGVELVVWLDSRGEQAAPTLEERVLGALDPSARGEVQRFGGLSLGESTHLVDEATLLVSLRQGVVRWNVPLKERLEARMASSGNPLRTFLLADQGLLGLPVWVDHVGSLGTVHAVGSLEATDGLTVPPSCRMPRIPTKAERNGEA